MSCENFESGESVRAVVVSFLVVAFLSPLSFAEDRSQGSPVLLGAGLDGRWAIDCNGPASAANIVLSYVTPDKGPPTERFSEDPVDVRTTELLDVKQLKNGDLEWVVAEGEVMITIQTQLKDNRLRTWSSVSSDGHQYITKAKTGDGKPVPWFNKCETN